MTITTSTQPAVFGFTIDGYVNSIPTTANDGTISHSEMFKNIYFTLPGGNLGQYGSLNIAGQRFYFSKNYSDAQKNYFSDESGGYYRVNDAYQVTMTLTFEKPDGSTYVQSNVVTNSFVMTQVDANGVAIVGAQPVTYYYPLSSYQGSTAFANYTLISANTTNVGQLSNGTAISAMSTTKTALKTGTCFALGTLIQTQNGWKAIEDLIAGDLILTIDNGLQPIKMIISRSICGFGKNAPIVINRGGVRPLVVSPLHRIYQQDIYADLLFGVPDFLVCAKDLVNHDTIYRSPRAEVTYFHILFDRHEIICADGIWAESMYLGSESLRVFDQNQLSDLQGLFPWVFETSEDEMKMSRECLRPHEYSVITQFNT